DVQADVLVVPIVGEPAFSGPLDEIDRRSGGELRALAEFRELRKKRYSSALAAAGELPFRRIVTVAVGDADTVDREVVVRVAAAAFRRLA
ncbi:M17 family peptidase N-terminal domain-containing protein, partial [Acinetobacter baumannii]